MSHLSGQDLFLSTGKQRRGNTRSSAGFSKQSNFAALTRVDTNMLSSLAAFAPHLFTTDMADESGGMERAAVQCRNLLQSANMIPEDPFCRALNEFLLKYFKAVCAFLEENHFRRHATLKSGDISHGSQYQLSVDFFKQDDGIRMELKDKVGERSSTEVFVQATDEKVGEQCVVILWDVRTKISIVVKIPAESKHEDIVQLFTYGMMEVYTEKHRLCFSSFDEGSSSTMATTSTIATTQPQLPIVGVGGSMADHSKKFKPTLDDIFLLFDRLLTLNICFHLLFINYFRFQ